MSEGGLVMPSCATANFNNNNNINNNNNVNGGRTGSVTPRRKYSFPAVLHAHGSLQAEFGFGAGANGGGGGGNSGGGPALAVATARRRFSNVSDVVSRKLSHTIGWRTTVPTDQIARQGKALCVHYFRWKLKRAGAYTRKCAGALRCVRAAANATAAAADVNGTNGGLFIPPQSGGSGGTGAGTGAGAGSGTGTGGGSGDHGDGVRRDVFPAMLRVGLQLERLDPKLYAGQPLQRPPQRPAYRRSAAACTTTAAVVLVSVARELFRAGAQVTWAKIVSLICVAAGLAVDCARYGRAEQLPDLIEAVGEVIEDDLAAWIHYNGGWMGLQSYCKPVVVNVENPVFTQILYLVSLLIVVILFLLLLRWFDFTSIIR